MTRITIQFSLLLLLALIAWKRGYRPELTITAVYIAMLVTDQIYHLAVRSFDLNAFPTDLHLPLDLAAFAAVYFVAVRSDSWWIVWIGSAQCLALTAHFLRMLDTQMPPQIYNLMEKSPVWLAMMVTALGICSSLLRDRSGSRKSS